MKILLLIGTGFVSLLLGAAAMATGTDDQPHSLKQGWRPSAGGIVPLRNSDNPVDTEGGCECGFTTGNRGYLTMVGHELMIRTGQGLQHCRISDAQFGSLGGANGHVACGGGTVTVRPTGRSHPHPELDSEDGPAVLIWRQGGRSQTISGRYGCAC